MTDLVRVETTDATTLRRARQQFRDLGFIVIPAMLDDDEVRTYREALGQLSGLDDSDTSRSWGLPDGVTRNEAFWPILFNERLLTTIRALLGPDIRYTQHSDLHVHRGGVGWHRDSAHREFGIGPDWNESSAPYSVVRVATYLQSYDEGRSALGVLPRSNRFEYRLTDRERRLWRLFGNGGPEGEFPSQDLVCSDPVPEMVVRGMVHRPTEPIWTPTEPGDTVVFDQRLLHSSSPVRGPKYGIFLSFGRDNEHSYNHLDYYYHQRPELGYEPIEGELRELLAKADLLLELDDAV